MSTTPRQPDQVIAQAMLAAAAETPPAAITTEEVAGARAPARACEARLRAEPAS
ncbi:MAG: hypothetical protein V9E93_01175 [Steroidobacteraceae bacterium]